MKKSVTILGLIFLFNTFLNAVNNNSNESYWHITTSSGYEHLLTFKIKEDNSFVFYSRKNAVKQYLGEKRFNMGYAAGKIKSSEMVRIEGTSYSKSDTLFLKGVYNSFYSEQGFEACIVNDEISGVLIHKSTRRNKFKGQSVDVFKPLKNYEAMIDSAIRITEENIYDAALLNTNEWMRYVNHLNSLKRFVCDDMDFEGVFNFSVSSLPFTHFGLSLNKKRLVPAKKKSKKAELKSFFNLEEKDTLTALFTINSFGGSKKHEMDSIITILKTKNYKNLIIDLRKNPGGTIENAMPLARYLVKDTTYGGVFLTRKWFDQHKNPPHVDDYARFQHFSHASFELIINGIHDQEGLCLKVIPDNKTYTGKIIILTSKRTASTCEPLVYALKSNPNTVVIGENTYGGMLNGEIFELYPEYTLWVPTAEYYTADGTRLDKIGVAPDIKCKAKEALEFTFQKILK